MQSGTITDGLHPEGNALSVDSSFGNGRVSAEGIQVGRRDGQHWGDEGIDTPRGKEIDSDRILFGSLVEQHQDYLFSFVYGMIGRYDDAQDLTAKAFLKAFIGFRKFRRGCTFRTWVTTVAKNLVKNYWRDRKPTNSTDIMEEDMGYIPPAKTLSPEDATVREENKKRIVQAITMLPMKYRPFVVMKHLHGLSYTEIAELNDVPVTTVRNRIHQGKKELEKIFNKMQIVIPAEGGYEIA